MNIGLLGYKIGMSKIFNYEGYLIPITIIKCEPCYINNILLIDNNYYIIQLGYIAISKKLRTYNIINYKKIKYKFYKEYKVNKFINFEIGHKFTLYDLFKNEKNVNITGLSIGKGYIGNIKKNKFKRGPMSHGSKHHRLQGSLGAGTDPGRVFPGKKMSGRHGFIKKTIKNLEIIKIDKNNNILMIKGSIPGKSGNIINITKTN